MNMGTPHPSRNKGKTLKSHGIERVKQRMKAVSRRKFIRYLEHVECKRKEV